MNTNPIDSRLSWPTSFDALENIPGVHTWNNSKISINYLSEKYCWEVGGLLEDKLDLYVHYRIESIYDIETRGHFRLLAKYITDVKWYYSNDDLTAIKEWLIESNETKLFIALNQHYHKDYFLTEKILDDIISDILDWVN